MPAPLLVAPIVAVIIEGLLWLFRSKIGLFIVAALAWLGLNLATMHVVLSPAIDIISAAFEGSLSSSGNDYVQAGFSYLGVMQFDRAVSMVVSAIVTRNVFKQGHVFLNRKAAMAGP